MTVATGGNFRPQNRDPSDYEETAGHHLRCLSNNSKPLGAVFA
jgi:hypothetical protein